MPWLFGVIIVLTGVCAAQVPKITGEFSFQNEVDGVATIDFHYLVLASPVDRAKLHKLEGRGYLCQRQPQQRMLCKKHISNIVPEELLERTRREFERSQVEFGERQGEPELLSEGEAFKAWKVVQPVRTLKGNYEFFEYWDLADIKKIVLRDHNDNITESYVYNRYDQNLKLMQKDTKSLSRQHWQIYWVDVVLRR